MGASGLKRTHVNPAAAAPLALIALVLGACTAAPNAPYIPKNLTLEGQPPTTAPPPYVLQVGDQIAIRFYQNPDLNEDEAVRPDGMISLQLIGDLPAAGHTPAELASMITQRYTGELANPRVTVIVRQFGGQRVYVGGEVLRQGTIPLVGNLTLFEAIQDAGGFTVTAHRTQVILIRHPQGEQPIGYEVDMRPVQDGEEPGKDVPLHPYDVVFVPKSKIADVNLFVQQYITNNIPPIPVAIPF